MNCVHPGLSVILHNVASPHFKLGGECITFLWFVVGKVNIGYS